MSCWNSLPTRIDTAEIRHVEIAEITFVVRIMIMSSAANRIRNRTSLVAPLVSYIQRTSLLL